MHEFIRPDINRVAFRHYDFTSTMMELTLGAEETVSSLLFFPRRPCLACLGADAVRSQSAQNRGRWPHDSNAALAPAKGSQHSSDGREESDQALSCAWCRRPGGLGLVQQRRGGLQKPHEKAVNESLDFSG